MKWSEKNPIYGDIIRVKVSFYYHYGIYVSDDSIIQFGLPTNVTQAAEDVKVIETDIQTFLCNGELEVATFSHSEKKKVFKPDIIIKNARSYIGDDGYHILHNNCEHFVNKCAFGEAKSDFLDNVRKQIKKKLG